MMKGFYTFGIMILIIAFSFEAMAQRGSGRGGNFGKPIGVLEGRIMDSRSHEGLPSAYLFLHSAKDSTLVSGGITDNDGNFKIDELPFGKYYMMVKYIGYGKKVIDDIFIKPDKQSVNLKNIEIELEAVAVGEVTVTAEKPRIEYSVDKKIVNVSKDLTAMGGSAVDVLENVPSVQVDIEGNVTLRGSSNFTVFVNGKPSVLEASDALEQIPATTIENIEIITNPSVKYDPDGVGGIVNIILKQQEESGVSGIFDVSVGTRDKYKFDALLNYKLNGFTIFGGFNYNDFNRWGQENSEQTSIYNNSETYIEQRSDRHMNRFGLDYKAGIAYDVNEDINIALEGRFGQFEFGRDLDSKMMLWEGDPSLTEYFRNTSLIERRRDYFSVHTDYFQKFNNQGHILSGGVYVSSRYGDGLDLQQEFITDENYDYIDAAVLKRKTEGDENSLDITAKLDYVLPVTEKMRFESGFQARIEPEEEKNLFYITDTLTNDWIYEPDYSSNTDFHRNIYSVYATFQDQMGELGYKAGLRGEYTDRNLEIIGYNENYRIDRVDWFPSVHISYKINDDNQIYTSYSRRIDRVRERHLDPHPIFIDQYNYHVGNPDLKPEYINSYELGYQLYFGKSFLSAESYYRNTTNIINRISSVEENGIVRHTFVNIDEDHSLGLELMANLQLVEWFNMNATFDAYNYWIEGRFEGADVNRNDILWGSRLNATFRLAKSSMIQANAFYRAPTITVQGERASVWGMNLAFRQDFFNRDLSLTLQARDVFSTYRRYMTVNQPNLVSSYRMEPVESPTINLTLSYKFNNYEKQKREFNGADSEMDIEY